jgi:pentatricopeptide repeat protein
MAITALLRAEGSRAALQAEDILQDFLHFYQNEGGWTNHDENHSKDEIVLQEHIQRMFENVLEALCQRAVVDTEAAERAVRILRYMDSKAQDFGELIVDSNTYNMVLYALAKQSSTSSISTIQDIISEMNQSYQLGRNDKAIVNTQTYNALIKAYVKNGDEKSAQATLYKMLHQYHEGNEHVRPDSVSWNLVIEAHAESAHEKAAHNISIILDKMHDFGKKHSDVQPDKITMSSVLKTLVRKASNGSKHAGKQAVQILDRMIEAHQKGNMQMKPDRIIFSSVINCIAKCGGKDAGSEALRILNRMQNMYKDGDLDLKPDTVTINTTLSALANTETRESALRSEHLLEAMITGDDPVMTPNVKSYTLVISAWAKSGARESLEKIEKLLLDMEKVDDEAKPNTFTYSTVLNAFAKSTDPSSYDRAIRVLQRMESGAIDVVPNSYCYASVMECISKSPDKDSICSRTIALLQRLIQQNKRNHICRDSYTVVFNTAIKAIERSSQEKKDRIALQILTLMKEANDSGKIIASPNARTYNSIIRACAFTTGSSSDKELAFDTAMSALDSIRSSKVLSPDLFTYPAIFRAGEELLTFTENNLERYRSLFHMACEDGLVDALLLKNMVNLLPKVLLRSLLGTEKDPSEVRLNDLPREWRRNIYKGKALGRKSGRNNYVDEK